MNETRYLISEASRITQVEAHVLRYWEEELGLAIGRNNMGHRYYTEKDIRTFMNIKELKKKGLQLRAIKEMLSEMDRQQQELPKVIVMSPQVFRGQEEVARITEKKEETQGTGQLPEDTEDSAQTAVAVEDSRRSPSREERFGQIMERLIHQLENSEKKEGRYRRLDEAIRRHQQSRKQVAVTEEESKKKTARKQKKAKQKKKS